MRDETDFVSLNLDRKGIDDTEGQVLIESLVNDKKIEKLSLEGNKLGIKSTKELTNMLSKNKTLK